MVRFSLFCLATLLAFCGSALSSDLRVAPFFMPLDGSPQTADDIVTNSGIKNVILAFVLAPNDGSCVPAWNGDPALKVADDQRVADFVKTLRSHGGDVSVSFGGYNGVELGHACKSPEDLAKAYQEVIDKYQLSHIDFDIEGDDLGVPVDEKRRFDAIKILKENAKKQGKRLVVSLTMPVTTVGFNMAGKDEMKRAITEGLDIDLYTPMVFDFGGSGSTQTQQVKSILEACHQELKTIRSDLSDEQVWHRMGMILMNGHTDQPSELYSQTTFKEMVQYAKQKGMARVSFWSLNRDRACEPNKNYGWVVANCSSIAQERYEFSKILEQFDSSNPHPDPDPTTTERNHHEKTTESTKATPTPSPKPDNVDCKNTHGEQYFPYNNDCHKYIRCYGGEKHIETCPDKTIYDLKLHICNWEQNVDRPECKHH